MPKLLTNIRFYTVAGIAQYLSGFVNYNEASGKFKIYGVDIFKPDEVQEIAPGKLRFKHFSLVKKVVDYPELEVVNNLCSGDIKVFRESYKDIIHTYEREIRRVKPDVILINGSYFLPWCLLQAAKAYGRAKIVVHYHGVLTKEVEHWDNKQHKLNMMKLEKDFYGRKITYIFPSLLAKKTVERQVFGRKLTDSIVMHNPIPEMFFVGKKTRLTGNKKIGVVSRWSKVKNMDFVIELAKHNSKRLDKYDINIITDKKSVRHGKKQFLGLVNFKKPVKKENLHKFYSNQGVVISPSNFETYGNVAQEAVASGTPALISKNMGVAEVFKKIGLKELVIDFDSPKEVFENIERATNTDIPQKSLDLLYENCASTNVFKKYFAILSASSKM